MVNVKWYGYDMKEKTIEPLEEFLKIKNSVLNTYNE